MTALSGLWYFDRRPVAHDGCKRMLDAQRIYSTGASATWFDSGLALGRRLTRLVPEDAFDRQPLLGGEGRYILVADIRLDNRPALTEALAIPLSRSRNMSDAAFLLSAIERWGEKCLEHIAGDYAFAVWDTVARKLFLARDPLGQRPLYYHRGDGFVAFASMPKGLHALQEVPYELNEEALCELLVRAQDGTRSYFTGIERVPPGCVVSITEGSLCSRRHWSPSRQVLALTGADEYAEALRELLDEAVRCRLRGAENVGTFLSGGIDSGAVTTTAARLLMGAGRNVVAFTAVPREGYKELGDRLVDESDHASATAGLSRNIEHVLVRSSRRDLLAPLDRNFLLFDEPVGSLCNTAWGDAIFDAARDRNLSVMLSGDFGNIGLSYDGFEFLPEAFRSGKWFALCKEMFAVVSKGTLSWRQVLGQTFGHLCSPELWIWLNQRFSKRDLSIIRFTGINPSRLTGGLATRAMRGGFDFRPLKDGFGWRVEALQGVDPGNYNKGILAGWQIDVRDPTADIRLLEFCLAVPTEQSLRKGVTRALARRALRDRLPRKVLEERRRGRQAADWHEQLTGARDRVADELQRLQACEPAARVIDLPRLLRLVEDWPADGWDEESTYYQYRMVLLRALSAGHFARRVTGANS